MLKKEDFTIAKIRHFWLLIKSFFKYALGIKKKNNRQSRIFSVGWRFFMVGLFVFFFINVFNPLAFLNLFGAENNKIDSISLFAGKIENIQTDKEWQYLNKAKGAPEIGPEDDFLSFNIDNSALYIGGRSDILVGGWQPLTADFRKSNPEQEKEEEISNDFNNVEIIDQVEEDSFFSTSTEKDNLEKEVIENMPETEQTATNTEEISAIATSSKQIDPEERNWVDFSDIKEKTFEENGNAIINENAQEQVIIEEESLEKPIDVKIEKIETETSAEEAAGSQIIAPNESEEQGIDDSIDNDEFSFFYDWEDNFSAQTANAQEYIDEEIKELDKLGKFQKATIKFSAAAYNQMNIEAEQEPIKELEEINDNTETASSAVLKEEFTNTAEESDFEQEEYQKQTEEEKNSQDVIGEEATNTEKISKQGWWQRFINSARAEEAYKPKISIWYSLEKNTGSSTDIVWQQLDVITADRLSNKTNSGYLSWDAPFIKSWQDINNFQIKLQGEYVDGQDFVFYLDSAWLEVEYEKEDELAKLKKRERWESALELLSEKSVFQMNEDGNFSFRYNKNEEHLWDNLKEIVGIGDYWQDVDIRINLIDNKNQTVDLPITTIFNEDGEFKVKIENNNQELQPGRYRLEFFIRDASSEEVEEFEIFQDFSWGVLAFNTNKSTYEAGETGYLQMAVLDSNGHTVCDAQVELEITSPQGQKIFLTTNELDGGNPLYSSFVIQTNPNCGPETITNKPDYFAYYEFEQAGSYSIKIIAITEGSEKTMNEIINVYDHNNTSVERIGPTRIYPKADYSMKIKVQVDTDFSGSIREIVPADFKILNYNLRITNNKLRDPFGPNYKYEETIDNNTKQIIWHGLEVYAGDELEIIYQFDAPNISPEFYLLGPAVLTEASSSKPIFEEERGWQIASDAVNKRARTVMFFAGANPGSSAQSTNANQTLSQFNFKLAENDVDIKNAYIVIESQLEAFLNTSGTYSGYTTAFDACEENCTASAFGAAQRITKTDNTVLAYDTVESMQSRILFDVTSEPQISSYTGGGVEMEAQIGYNYFSSTTRAALAHTQALLVLTYTYDADSENITNTVVYPLEAAGTSESPGDSGTRQGVFSGTCTFTGADCPTFDFNMEIPEWGGVATTSNRISQWFNMTQINDSHGGTDVDIQTRVDSGAASNAFHHEAQNGSTQGNFPDMYFNDLNNYAENKTQTLEYQITDGNINSYTIGGEVFETYIASSSKATKTRTVAFPLGVLQNGVSTNWGDKTANIYFPENGNATGTVSVKKAWVRLNTNSHQAGRVTSIQTKVGSNATSSTWTYDSNTGGNIPKPAFSIFHVIPSDQYSALENANSATSVPVVINAQNNTADMGGISAELVITYTYTSENKGYLTNLHILGIQMDSTASTSVIGTTSNLVLPEAGGKIIRGASLHTSFLSSDDRNTYPAGQFILDANVSSTTPSCSNSYYSLADATNMFTEHYKDISSAIGSTDGQSYNICLSNNGNQFPLNGGAKMNAVLSYVYSWVNTPPTGSFNSASQKTNGSGSIDISIEADDIDKHDIKAKIEYATGTSCVFSPGSDPSLDEADGNVTADFGDPNLENDNVYQVGNSSAYITTASGSNSVNFDWLAKSDLGVVDGDYCLRLTVNDLMADQTVPATTTVYIDTSPPTQPGPLSLYSRSGTSLILSFGATTTEQNFMDYRIYYKVKDGTDPTEGDSVLASSTDASLGDILYSGDSTTTISGLIASTTYSLAVWAYDVYGNKASSSSVNITTNDAPTGYFYMPDTGQKKNGSGVVDIGINVDDLNNQDTLKAKIEYEQGAACLFSPPQDPSLDETPGNVSASFGTVVLDDDEEYQVGSSTGWIITSPGENTIGFDWKSYLDEPEADSIYCLRLTVNDRFDDMLVPATATITVDNLVPTTTGNLAPGTVTTDSITLLFNISNPGQDTNEPTANAYKIFYKQGTSGVTEGGDSSEQDDSALDAYDFSGATSTEVSGLEQNTWYVFNIWTYDEYGNRASATEVAIKTNATLSNDSLVLTNSLGYGTTTNVIIAGTSTEWNIRAVVSETNGWYSIGSTTLRLADNSDDASPFDDLIFYWNQSDSSFYDLSQDSQSSVNLTSNSTSTCAGIACTLDFKLQFNKNFQTAGTEYTATLFSTNDFSTTDYDVYPAFYQIRFPYLEQTHYRWRYDDGGE